MRQRGLYANGGKAPEGKIGVINGFRVVMVVGFCDRMDRGHRTVSGNVCGGRWNGDTKDASISNFNFFVTPSIMSLSAFTDPGIPISRRLRAGSLNYAN